MITNKFCLEKTIFIKDNSESYKLSRITLLNNSEVDTLNNIISSGIVQSIPDGVIINISKDVSEINNLKSIDFKEYKREMLSKGKFINFTRKLEKSNLIVTYTILDKLSTVKISNDYSYYKIYDLKGFQNKEGFLATDYFINQYNINVYHHFIGMVNDTTIYVKVDVSDVVKPTESYIKYIKGREIVNNDKSDDLNSLISNILYYRKTIDPSLTLYLIKSYDFEKEIKLLKDKMTYEEYVMISELDSSKKNDLVKVYLSRYNPLSVSYKFWIKNIKYKIHNILNSSYDLYNEGINYKILHDIISDGNINLGDLKYKIIQLKSILAEILIDLNLILVNDNYTEAEKQVYINYYYTLVGFYVKITTYNALSIIGDYKTSTLTQSNVLVDVKLIIKNKSLEIKSLYGIYD